MRELALSFCYQLQSKYLDTASGEQVSHRATHLPSCIHLKISSCRCLANRGASASPTGDQELAVRRQSDLPHFPRVPNHNSSGRRERGRGWANGEWWWGRWRRGERGRWKRRGGGRRWQRRQASFPAVADEEAVSDGKERSCICSQSSPQGTKHFCLVFLNPVMIEVPETWLFVLHCDFSQRTCVFKFLGAMAMDLGKERLAPYLTTIITPLYRELDSTYADQGNCSEPVLPRIKSVRFTEWPLLSPNLWSRSHTEEPCSGAHRADEETGGPGEILPGLLCRPEGILTETSGTQTTQSHAGMMDVAMRHTRETALICHRSSSQFLLRSLQAVANPDIAAKKKLKKHKNKIEAKKRKIEFLRPGYKAKKQRSHALKDLAMVQWAEDARRGWKLGQLMQNRLKRKRG